MSFTYEIDNQPLFQTLGQDYWQEPEAKKPITGKAYDADFNVRYFQEFLTAGYGEDEIRQHLSERIAIELLTHFAELEEVKVFSWNYLINTDGEITEDTVIAQPLKKYYQSGRSLEDDLWLKVMIPGLEDLAIGGSAFSLSAKKDNAKLEGAYDFAYFFQKIDEKKIICFGINLDLSKQEQATIINNQLVEQGRILELLTAKPLCEEVRSRPFFFPPGKFASIEQAFLKLIAEPLKKLRGDYPLDSQEKFSFFVETQLAKTQKRRPKALRLAERLTEGIIAGQINILSSMIGFEQKEILWQIAPQMMLEYLQEGRREVVLPCGTVELDFDLKITTGDNLMELTIKTLKCVECPFCHQTVDAIVTASKIKCPKCNAEVRK